MITPPHTRYAKVGDNAYVGYQVIGDGPIDIVYHAGWYSHIEAQWAERGLARFLERLASFSRLIVFDRRGHGVSDPIDLDNITLEQWMEDATAVMDAVGSERAVMVGTTEAGPMQILQAATHPERTAALVLINTSACAARVPDYPWGMPDRVQERVAAMMRDLLLGDPETSTASYEMALGLTSGSTQASDGLRLTRYATSPGMVYRLMRISLQQDVRHILPLVRVPTLIIHRADQTFMRVDHGRYLAEHIDGARYVELPGTGLLPFFGDQNAILDEIEEFVTGVRPMREPDRVLSTVLFTDIVSSTERAVAAGDRKWLGVLENHNTIVRRELERHRGREVNTAGDGFVATFDGPARAVRCACSIIEGVRDLGIDVRAGLHTGEVELAGNDVGGIAIHIGRRVSDLAAPGEVLVSRTVVDLVTGSGLEFAERGAHALKGVPGEWQLYAVER
jgi:class 3 adenylate cyclase/pimeloyl-ACP methyl ester carboxylesterase